jgi:hypothetical protein
MHRHGAIQVVCETYGAQVLGIRPDDRCLSAAKAFFAYGLGNSVLFPLSVGATAILEPAPSRPDLIADGHGSTGRRCSSPARRSSPTCCAPTCRRTRSRACGSRLGRRGAARRALRALDQHFGVDILDGIGMTEMLHIFLSNRRAPCGRARPASRCPATTCACSTRTATRSPPGTPGTLYVRGESTATGYWSRYDASRQVFQGEWLRTGDTYVQRRRRLLRVPGPHRRHDQGQRHLGHAGRGRGPAAAAPGVAPGRRRRRGDADGLEKPVAYVVTAPGAVGHGGELIEFCRAGLPSFKRPRRVVFTDALPHHRHRQGPPRRAAHDGRGVLGRGHAVRPSRRARARRPLMLDGRPLIDVHLHAARLPTLKPAWDEWVQGFGDADVMDRLYDETGTCSRRRSTPPRAEGVDVALLLCEYSPKVTGLQVDRGHAAARGQPGRIKPIANINPHLHYPVDEESAASSTSARSPQAPPVHAGVAANDRSLYPAYEACQAAGDPARRALRDQHVPRLVQQIRRPGRCSTTCCATSAR